MLKAKALWMGAAAVLGVAAIMGVGYKAGKEVGPTTKKTGTVKNQQTTTNRNSSSAKSSSSKNTNSAALAGFDLSNKKGGELKESYYILGFAFGDHASYERLQIVFTTVSGVKKASPKYQTSMSGNNIYVRVFDAKAFNFDTGKPTYTMAKEISGKKVIKKAIVVDSGMAEEVLVQITLNYSSPYRVSLSSSPIGVMVDVQK